MMNVKTTIGMIGMAAAALAAAPASAEAGCHDHARRRGYQRTVYVQPAPVSYAYVQQPVVVQRPVVVQQPVYYSQPVYVPATTSYSTLRINVGDHGCKPVKYLRKQFKAIRSHHHKHHHHGHHDRGFSISFNRHR